MSVICAWKLAITEGSLTTTVKLPARSLYSPKFLLKLWEQKISKPWSTKNRTAQASVSREPLAKPWYAQSKKTKRFLDLQTSAI